MKEPIDRGLVLRLPFLQRARSMKGRHPMASRKGAFSFRSRDEAEVGGYAEAMEVIFSDHYQLSLTENHIKQLHTTLLKFSPKDERHRGEYKKFPNHVEAFDPKGKRLGVVFETATPFSKKSRAVDVQLAGLLSKVQRDRHSS